jgi:hypothetical protein
MDCIFKKGYGFRAVLMGAVVLSLFHGRADAFAEDQPCLFDVPQTELKVASCVQEGGVNILKLVPRNQPDYANNFDNLPTVIVTGKNLQDISAVIGIDNTRRYNKLIELPDADSIKEFSDAAATAKASMKQQGWKLLDMKNVIYPGRGGVEGFGLICNTLQAETTKGFVVVSQCNTFYENERSSLKKILSRITCEPPKSEAFPALNTDADSIVFNYAKLPEEFQGSHDVAIDIDFVNCVDGTKKNIGSLPFWRLLDECKRLSLRRLNLKPSRCYSSFMRSESELIRALIIWASITPLMRIPVRRRVT